MSVSDRILSSLRAVILLEDRLARLEQNVATIKTNAADQIADHEKRLIRLETIVEIARPDGGILRIGLVGDSEPQAS